jgi:PqqD family protein of HPr-rel-A system
MTSSPIWRLAPGQRLLHRCWDGECVLYNDLSGDTHLLDEFALALLQQLQAEPQPAARLAANFGVEDLDNPADLLHEVLTELSALHLIDTIAC